MTTITVMFPKNINVCFILFNVLFGTCTGVTVTIESLNDVAEGTETRMICNYSPTTGSTIIITWSNVTGGASETIATTIVGATKTVDPAYSTIFTLDPNDDKALMIANTLRSYSGDYQCEVINLDNPPIDTDVVTLNVIYIEDPVLSFTTPVNEGDQVTLSCDVVYKPDGMFTFKKDGSMLQQGGLSTYTWSPVNREDQGSYTCETSNSAGTKETAGQVLDVYFAPEITALEDMEVSRGETVVISFGVEARPAANYDWSSQGATDTDSDPETFTFVASNTIGDVYTVTLNASNEVAASQSTVQVTVVDSCGSLSIVRENGDQVDGNMNAEVGDDVSLRCQCGDSDEGFEYEWTLDGDKRSESTLTFTAEKSGHEVVCIGTAGAPEPSSVSINVLVTDKVVCTEDKHSTGLVVGMTFVGVFIGCMLSLLTFFVIKKLWPAKVSLSKSDNQSGEYTTYIGEMNQGISHTYEELQKKDKNQVYENVKA